MSKRNKMVSITCKGDFKKAETWMQQILEVVNLSILDKYGKLGVRELKHATPRDTGKTANSWTYDIVFSEGKATIIWSNKNVVDHQNIALLIQYGHGTKSGTYVTGVDYINPALKPVFDSLAAEAWAEVMAK